MSYMDLNVNLGEDEIALRENTNKFAREVMRPLSRQLDEMSAEAAIADDSPYWTFMRQAYHLGYHKLCFPEEFGGLGLTPLQTTIVMEELAWGSFGLTLSLNTSLEAVVAMGATDEHRRQFTIPFCECTDGTYIGCWAISEPDHGSDCMVGLPGFRDSSITPQCRAYPDGEGYVIRGQKSAWVSNGTLANNVLLMAQLDPSMGFAGSGMFLFSLDRPGVSKGKPLNKLGCRELNQGEIYFDDVRVPGAALVVGPAAYEFAVEALTSLTLPMVAIWSVGLARAGFEEALDYARIRVQGGKPLVEHANVQDKLFRMFSKVEAARQFARAVFVYNWSNPPEKRVNEYGEAAKIFATQVALDVTNDAIQIFGGNGLSKEYIIEKLFRDARASLICDGSNDTLALSGGHKVASTYPRTNYRMESTKTTAV